MTKLTEKEMVIIEQEFKTVLSEINAPLYDFDDIVKGAREKFKNKVWYSYCTSLQSEYFNNKHKEFVKQFGAVRLNLYLREKAILKVVSKKLNVS